MNTTSLLPKQKKEKNRHKIILKTNKKSRLEFFGKGINEHLLKAIFNTELDYDFDALVYNFSISHPVKEFRIYFEINSQILYYSEDFEVEDLINNKNKELVFFNFDLKFQNSKIKEFILPPRTSNLNPLNSIKILKSCFI